jgi:hypothetical protein
LSKEPTISGKPIQRAKPRAADENKAQSTPNANMQIDPTLDDDELEIPAFLRRQTS